MDISTFDKEVKAALDSLPKEPVSAVKAVVSAAQNFSDCYFVDITWNDGLNETTSQLKIDRDIDPAKIKEMIKASFDIAVMQALM